MTTFKNNIRICLQNASKETRVNLCPNKNVNIDLGNRVVLKYIDPNHNELDNLDYEHSGHTGFMPAKLSLLPKVPKAVQNGHLLLTTYDKNTDTTHSIELDDLRKRIIKTSTSLSSDDQKGQYIFMKINKEEN